MAAQVSARHPYLMIIADEAKRMIHVEVMHQNAGLLASQSANVI